MGTSLLTIQQGESVVVEAELFFLGTGSAGDPASPRRMVWPSAVSPLLAPLVYSVDSSGITLNPTRTLNFDTQVLPHPRTQVVETLGTSRVVRFERGVSDVVVTEVWDPAAGASMPTSLLRLFYEYLRNGALLPAAGPFITWEPRDRSERVYEVALVSLSAGGTDEETRFDIADVRADPLTSAKVFDDALRSLSPTPTGLVTTEVQLRFLVLGEVS